MNLLAESDLAYLLNFLWDLKSDNLGLGSCCTSFSMLKEFISVNNKKFLQ